MKCIGRPMIMPKGAAQSRVQWHSGKGRRILAKCGNSTLIRSRVQFPVLAPFNLGNRNIILRHAWSSGLMGELVKRPEL